MKELAVDLWYAVRTKARNKRANLSTLAWRHNIQSLALVNLRLITGSAATPHHMNELAVMLLLEDGV